MSTLFSQRVFNTQKDIDSSLVQPAAADGFDPNNRVPFSIQERAGVGFTSKRARDQLTQQLADLGIQNSQVLAAINTVPRHLFVDEALRPHSYQNRTLPIGAGQTISQPWVVARMTELLLASARPMQHVLEVGSGCGYQTAVLSALVQQLHSVERIQELHLRGKQVLARLGIQNAALSLADGHWGLPSAAPFDGILVTAAPETVPEELLEQLAIGGRLVIPAGPDGQQRLQVFDRVQKNDFEQQFLDEVAFVPLKTGVLKV